MWLVFEKKCIFFFKRCLFWKKTFSQNLVFLFIFFSKFFIFKCVYFTFESCLSLIMASGSQLNVKTIKYIILIVLAGCIIQVKS